MKSEFLKLQGIIGTVQHPLFNSTSHRWMLSTSVLVCETKPIKGTCRSEIQPNPLNQLQYKPASGRMGNIHFGNWR